MLVCGGLLGCCVLVHWWVVMALGSMLILFKGNASAACSPTAFTHMLPDACCQLLFSRCLSSQSNLFCENP
jgi:hypothetical protein